MTYALPKLMLLLLSLCFGKLEAVTFLDNNCQAGFSPMMINSRNANRAPWMAYLIKDGKYICGGSLVNHQFVLTAAHCANSVQNLIARLGEYDSSIETDGETLDIGVSIIFFAPLGQDISLLKLLTRTNYTATIKPICIVLWTCNEDLRELHSVNKYIVTGWGQISRVNRTASTILQEISVSRINPSLCGNFFGQICCENPSQFVCHGDSGSPLTSEHKYNHVTSTVLYGVLSSGHERCYDYARYVDIAPYTPWIYYIIKSYF
ncbi:chymotrypsin-like protease CTRL-1 [Drosophila kikkawai]|uniref:Chymotrypsin-like protease CTRL-1 n=1 Tax=Drosophila kikkawai TaxID=30033 RepID=A0A6P4I631_DROKI|nr:chymotrypsin-like protease CTRL-1 [Drosophila kikkawai]